MKDIISLRVLLLIAMIFAVMHVNSQNKAMGFDYGDYAHVEGADAEGFTGLTLESWVFLGHYLNLPGTEYSGSFIIAKEASSPVIKDYGFLLVVLSSLSTEPGSLAFGLNFEDNGNNVHEGLHSYAQVPLLQWVHLAATWDGDSMSVFINGVFDRSLDVSQYGNAFYDPPDDSLNIGDRRVGPAFGATYGYIDEVRIWNIARTIDEIRETMYTELTGNESGLWAYYKLNEGSVGGQYFYDSGPNGFDGWRGSSSSSDINDPSWINNSTSPLPYYTIQDNNWSNNSTWASGQLVPQNPWAIVQIKNAVTLDQDATVKDLDVNTTGSLTIDATYTLTVDGDFKINSDNAGTGSFIDEGNLDAAREPIVERYLTQNKWHFIGIPVENDSVGVFYIPGGSDIYLRTHQESNNSWGPWITNVNTPLLQGRGYEVWVSNNVNQDETINFRGALNTGDFTTGSGGFYDLQYTPPNHGLNLISNPYPSALNADIQNWTKTNVDNKVWTWNPDAGNYVYWTGTSGTNNDDWGTLTNGVIPSMQAFFVQATGANPELTIPQSSRVHSSQPFYKTSALPANSIKLSAKGNGYEDGIFIGFNKDATNSYDNNFDLRKLFGLDQAPQLYTIAGSDSLSINVLAPLVNSQSVALQFTCEQDGWFDLIFDDAGNFNNGIKFFLEDLVEDDIVPINVGDNYHFYHQADNDESRFIMHFSVQTGIEKVSDLDYRIVTLMDKLKIFFPENIRADVALYSTDGRLISSANLKSGNDVDIPYGKSTGVHILRVLSDKGSSTRKVYIP